jgi:hypothetical protein
MRILFDHGTPAPLIAFLEGHAVTKAKDAGWDRFVNGELLDAAEATGFELLVTPDKNMRYQQNLLGRKSPSSFWGTHNGLCCAATLTGWWVQ